MLEVYCKTLPSKYDTYTASRHIDVLTFGRINSIGFDNLTDYQKEIIQKVCENLAIFEFNYKSSLTAPVSSLSISGVSVTTSFDNSVFHKQDGVVIYQSDYDLLASTGLCSYIL